MRRTEREGVADVKRCTHTALRKGDSPLSADDKVGGTPRARLNGSPSQLTARHFEALAFAVD